MKSAPILLVALGLLLLYVILSNSYVCFTEFFSCLTGADMRTPEGYTRGQPQTQTPPTTGTGGFDPYKEGILDLYDRIIHGRW